MREWAKTAGNPPQWTMETKLKMMEMYSLLEERIEKNTQWCRLRGVTDRLMKMERVETTIDFATEFTSLTTTVLSFFAPGTLSIVDLQREFELAAHDEELCTVAGEGENEKEENAVITTVREESAVITTANEESAVIMAAKEDSAVITTKEASVADEEKANITMVEESPKKSATTSKSASEGGKSSIRNWKGITVVVTMSVYDV